ncbi:MAG: hypothetical protein M1822_003991 [Bathelium mastoideum]|nr:MAG: hypothetical protein M1822_003991 [Bathelium mastoideum]
MPPAAVQQLLLSPAELSYLHSSLFLQPPIRPDGRTPTQFRPLVAESDILPNTNGSARICFADGTEAIVGVKAEMEKSAWRPDIEISGAEGLVDEGDDEDGGDEEGGGGGNSGERQKRRQGIGQNSWVEMSVEIPGYRDDDAMPVFLAAMLTEALLATGTLKDRLWINDRFHWKLYIDILLLSPPLSYPLPLLSLTTHLALLSARLPALVSSPADDPLFNDDWEAASYLYPRSSSSSPNSNTRTDYPSITLLVMSVGATIVFDPSREELAVADAVLAISVSRDTSSSTSIAGGGDTQKAHHHHHQQPVRLLAIRSVDPPSRLTPPGVPDRMNAATGGSAPVGSREALAVREGMEEGEEGGTGVWRPPRGGVKRDVLARMIKMVVGRGGVAEEVFDALEKVET